MRTNDIQIKGNFIGGRQGYAYTFNSGKIKTVKIDLDKKQEYDTYKSWRDIIKVNKQTSRGSIDVTCSIGQTINADGTLVWEITSWGCCLSGSFGYSDLMELANSANLPIVQTEDIVGLCQFSDESKFAYVQLFKVGRVDINCQTVAKLIPLNDDEMQEVAEKANRWCNR